MIFKANYLYIIDHKLDFFKEIHFFYKQKCSFKQ